MFQDKDAYFNGELSICVGDIRRFLPTLRWIVVYKTTNQWIASDTKVIYSVKTRLERWLLARACIVFCRPADIQWIFRAWVANQSARKWILTAVHLHFGDWSLIITIILNFWNFCSASFSCWRKRKLSQRRMPLRETTQKGMLARMKLRFVWMFWGSCVNNDSSN